MKKSYQKKNGIFILAFMERQHKLGAREDKFGARDRPIIVSSFFMSFFCILQGERMLGN